MADTSRRPGLWSALLSGRDPRVVPAPVPLRTLPGPDGAGRIQLLRGDDLVGAVDAGPDGRASVRLGAHLWGRPESAFVVRALADAVEAAAGGPTQVHLDTVHVLVRYEARLAGLTGGLRDTLRGQLRRPPADPEPVPPLGPQGVAAAVQALLPGARISATPVTNLARWGSAGFGSMVDLTVHDPTGDRPLLVACPDAADFIPEAVAVVVDTVSRVRQRFPAGGVALERVSFDHSSHGFRTSQHAGHAHRSVARIGINASLVSAGGLLELARSQANAAARRLPAVSSSPSRATALDGTAAHEAWHQMERVYEVRSYPATIAFRRRIGEGLGVETLEHAVLGRAAGAPPAWRNAHAGLVAQVSAYAATSTAEATAELFKRWWCVPEPRWSPVVRAFDEALAILRPL